MASRSREAKGVTMSFNSPNWTPVPPLPPSQGHVPACARCGHDAGAHRNPASCSVRGRWWRRCRCTGYLRSDAAAAPSRNR